MALVSSTMTPLGAPAPDFSLPGTDGMTHRLADFADYPVLVVVFMCNHCPYVQAIDDRLVAFQADYADRGVRLVGINPNDATSYSEDSFENMQRRARAKGYNFPYLHDESQAVARAYGAVCTPDYFVYGADRRLAYRGRLDDSWREAAKVVRRDLRDAVDALLAGAEVAAEQTPSMGCSIKWR